MVRVLLLFLFKNTVQMIRFEKKEGKTMSGVTKVLKLGELEQALNALEKQIDDLGNQTPKEDAELAQNLEKQEAMREKVTHILDETIEKVEKLIEAQG